MPVLIILTVVFLLLILAIVWGHFVKQNKASIIVNNTHRDDTNVSLYHEHKNEIESDFQQGRIDEENYQYLIAELDKSLLQDIEINKKASTEGAIESKSISILWPLAITFFVLVFSFWMYNINGAYQQLSQPLNIAPNQSAETPNDNDAEKMVAHIKSLIDLTVAEPNNPDPWYGLGQAFVSIGQFDKSIESFDQVIRIEGISAELLGAKAQALYYRDNQSITADVQSFIDEALALDPTDASTNILLGMHNFVNQNYPEAITYWEVVINANKNSVNTKALTDAISEAKNRINQINPLAQQKQTNADSIKQKNKGLQSKSPQITVNVGVSDKIKDLLIDGPDKVVFVYAVSSDAKHGRMPVAAVKMRASDLPVTIVLDDSKAMTPQAKISDVPAVNIYAVISASGSVGVKSGDFKTESLNTDVLLTTPLSLTIDTVVP